MKTLIIITGILLTGCASTYTCQDYPTGQCQTLSKVYKNSKKKESLMTKGEDEEISISKNTIAIENPTIARPLLSRPKTLRIFVNHWEDEDGDLHVGGYIYVRFKDSLWKM